MYTTCTLKLSCMDYACNIFCLHYEYDACIGICKLNPNYSDNVTFVFQAHLRYVSNNNNCYDYNI